MVDKDDRQTFTAGRIWLTGRERSFKECFLTIATPLNGFWHPLMQMYEALQTTLVAMPSFTRPGYHAEVRWFPGRLTIIKKYQR